MCEAWWSTGSDTLNLIKAVLVSYLLGKVHLSSHEAETVDYLEGRGVQHTMILKML